MGFLTLRCGTEFIIRAGEIASVFSRIVAEKAVEACLLEASGFPKPGNVWPGKRVGKLEHEDFVKAAGAIEKTCALAAERGGELKAGERKASEVGLGELFLLAARETRKRVGREKGNVNAGIILLLVPLCAAFGFAGEKEKNDERKLRKAVGEIVRAGTVEDAVGLFEALKLLAPRVKEKKKLSLKDEESVEQLRRKKIRLAGVLRESFGSVPRELLNGFQKSFQVAEWLRELKKEKRKTTERKKIAQVFLRVLSEWNDSLVELKGGKKKARDVKRRATEALRSGGVFTSEGLRKALELDEWLRERKLNPGSSADLVCAGIFAELMSRSEL